MDISADKSKSGRNRPRPILAVSKTIQGFIRGLIGLFILTEEEYWEAGVIEDKKWRDG